MPIYEYRRPDGTTFEVMQKFSDDPLTADPDTGVPVERVLSAPAIHFKGSGFHNTDYGTRRRNKEKAAEAGGSAESGGSKDAGSSGSSSGGDGTSGGSSTSTGSAPAKGSSGSAKD